MTVRTIAPVEAAEGTRPAVVTAVLPTDARPATSGSREVRGATTAHVPAPRRAHGAPAGPDGDPAADAAPSAHRPVLRVLRTHLGTVAGAVILGVLLWRLGTGVFLDGLRRIDVPTLFAGLGIGVLTTVFSAWRWCRVARALDIRLPLGAAVADYYRALFLNAALPGGVLGDVHRAVRHGQSAGDVGRGVRAVVLERTAGQVALVTVGVPVLLTLPSPVLVQTRHLAGLPALAALGALAVVAAVRMGRPRRPSRWRRALGAALTEARTALLARGSWPAVLSSSVVVLAGHLLMFWVAARVAGSQASPLTLLPLALLA
ncbi:lysylphosphatidylglycerol synthase transmembrane domain-containing protein, partial [Streptomyces chiangmaiensis]